MSDDPVGDGGAGRHGPGRDAAPDGRDESRAERADRNWSDLLQELRISQTGVQILTGFLLTLPFQQRFTELDDYQRVLYLVLVLTAVATTGLLVTPAVVHRAVFRHRVKHELVETSNRIARVCFALVAMLMVGAAMLVVDVVVGRAAGLAVAVTVALGFAALWSFVPRRVTRGSDA
ncbi:DUF6328 family protein [Sanguibacter sp. A247]|uniref:DUF6328 family protein n=1 Tax=unclassified Sanguibacter TaxID=2645534 RepID=UPI003FD79160